MRPENLRLILSAGALAFLGLFFSCREIPPAYERELSAYPARLEGVPETRAAVAGGPSGVKVAVTGRFGLFTGAGREIPTENRRLDPVRVRGSGGGLAVGPVRLKYGTIEFRPRAGEEVLADGAPLPGALRIARCASRSENGTAPDEVKALALLDVETYVGAALAARTDWRRWSEAALEAHAVALRTLALYERSIARGEGRPWDTEDDDLLPVFREGSWRAPRIARAVNGTRGLVLAWDRRLFPAFMTPSCGGRTEEASRVLTSSLITPLSGRECPYCAKIPHPDASWKVRLSAGQLEARLRPEVEGKGRMKLGRINRIEAVGRGASGRVRRVRIDQTYGPIEMDGLGFTKALGEEVLPSALFTVGDVGRDIWEFKGRGRGHGVGLCQYGAEEMAREGHSYVEIVEYYFPGAELARLPYASPRRHGDTEKGRLGAPDKTPATEVTEFGKRHENIILAFLGVLCELCGSFCWRL